MSHEDLAHENRADVYQLQQRVRRLLSEESNDTDNERGKSLEIFDCKRSLEDKRDNEKKSNDHNQFCRFVLASVSTYRWKRSKLSSKQKCTEFIELMLCPFITMYESGIKRYSIRLCAGQEESEKLISGMKRQLASELTAVFQKSLIERIKIFKRRLNPIINPSLISVSMHLDQFLDGHNGWLSYFIETPVLLKLCGIITLSKLRNDLTIMRRLIKDQDEISRVFGVSLPIQIKDITASLSDPHKGRQSVAIIEFTDQKKIVYKPRSLSCDELYTRLVKILDTRDQLTNPVLINKLEYGWAEFIRRIDPKDENEIQEYYKNLGRIFALFDFIGGIDFHEENFIVHATSPVPIDLEGVFSPVEIPPELDKNDIPDEFRVHQLDATCILPRYQYFDASRRIIPLGPLVLGEKVNTTISLSSTMINENTLQASLDESKRVQSSNEHVVHVAGLPVDPCNYKDFLLDGFKEAYENILEKKEQINNIAETYRDERICIRRLFRPTLDYALIMRDLTSYSHLKSNSSLRAWLRDRLYSGIDQVNDTDKRSVIESEVKQLLNLDVPAFYQDVFRGTFSDDSIRLSDQSTITPYNQFLSISASRSNQYINYALGYIKKTILLYQGNKTIRKRLELSKFSFTKRPLQKNIDELAINLLEYLKINATTDDKSRPIYSLNLTSLSGSTGISMVANAPHYLEGISGIIIFAKTAAISGLPVDINWLSELTSNYYQTICLFSQRGLIDGSGLYGLTGAIYPLIYRYEELIQHDTTIATVANNDLHRALDLTSKITFKKLQRVSEDFLSGTCSNLTLLSLLNNYAPNDTFRPDAELEYRRLVRTIRSPRGRLSYFDLKQNGDPMAGLAHGQSGALVALSHYSATVESHDSILQDMDIALDFERSLIDSKVNKFSNYPNKSKTLNIMGWCNGPAGLGLVRLLLLKNHGYDEKIASDIRNVIACLLNRRNKNDSFCCGNASILLFLSKAARLEEFDQEFDLQERVEDLANQLVSDLVEDGELNLSTGKAFLASSGLLGGVTGVILSLMNAVNNNEHIDPFLLG